MTGKHLEFTQKVSEGDIIFFSIYHYAWCRPVQSDKERIIFSFNIAAYNECTNTSRVATYATTSNAK